MAWKAGVGFLILAALAVPAAGQPTQAAIQAMAAFKEANTAYSEQDYRRAAGLYERAIFFDPDNSSGAIGQAEFFLGNSNDALWIPQRRGEAANDHLLEVAVAHYRRALDMLGRDKPEDQRLRKLALDYMVAACSFEKLNDPVTAEQVIVAEIARDPARVEYYFALAKLYEDVGEYEAAERILLTARDRNPRDPAVFMQLAGYYNRQGIFDETIAALQRRVLIEPGNPEASYTIATYYWDKAYRDFKLTADEKRDFVGKGLEAIDRALQLKPDYVEALIYKNLLLRIEANVEVDPVRQQDLLRQADELRDRAQALRRKQP